MKKLCVILWVMTLMLAAVLHSETAIQVSIKIMNAFVQLRHYVSEQVLTTDDKADSLDYIKINISKNVRIALGKYFDFTI